MTMSTCRMSHAIQIIEKIRGKFEPKNPQNVGRLSTVSTGLPELDFLLTVVLLFVISLGFGVSLFFVVLPVIIVSPSCNSGKQSGS